MDLGGTDKAKQHFMRVAKHPEDKTLSLRQKHAEETSEGIAKCKCADGPPLGSVVWQQQDRQSFVL
ncbi:hypothetical protein U0070_012569 [Myodes glareolus]|uniref:Uncharacterized protein n=1 Tax=Myodes glareolus TaxID=447135 RepID=A0AAW0HF86_MYOGA